MLFSIIIPVYNVEKYLDECLHSVIPQVEQLKDCEIILVDDGSTDSGSKVCDAYQEKYPGLIRVYHNENHGLLYARRYGYERAKGRYIINCDSDDLLEPDALEKIHAAIEKYNEPDVILFNYYEYTDGKRFPVYNNIFSENKDCKVPKKEVLKEFFTGHKIVSMWSKAYKRECAGPEKNYDAFGRFNTGEDTLQTIEIFTGAESFVYVNEPLYDYRMGSGMTCKFDMAYYFTFKTVFEELWLKKSEWKMDDFDRLFSVKVLQTAGRAITQSRYNRWDNSKDHIEYLKKIRCDSMLTENLEYLNDDRALLQKDHYILLKFLKRKMYFEIVVMLRLKNKIG